MRNINSSAFQEKPLEGKIETVFYAFYPVDKLLWRWLEKGPCQISIMELFNENNRRLEIINNFRKNIDL